MPDTRVEIINLALVAIGAVPVSFADSEEEESSDLVATYELAIEKVLAVYPWRSTLSLRALAQGTKEALSPWDYAYPLPSPRIGNPRRLWKSTALTDSSLLKMFELGIDNSGNGAVLTDETVCVVEYQRRPALTVLDPCLLDLLVGDLKARFWVQVAADHAKAGDQYDVTWRQTDGTVPGLYFLAKQAESVAAPTRTVSLEDGPLVSARR